MTAIVDIIDVRCFKTEIQIVTVAVHCNYLNRELDSDIGLLQTSSLNNLRRISRGAAVITAGK
jgi:hypothetical protein